LRFIFVNPNLLRNFAQTQVILNPMVSLNILFLFDLGTVTRLDIMAWVVGVPVVIAAIVLLFVQQRQSRQLQEDLHQLSKIKRHTIEYELVLKTMKLSIWHMDVPTKAITYESDYRDAFDMAEIPPGTSFSALVDMIDPAYVDTMSKNMNDLVEGRVENYHMQYEVKIPHSDRTYWEESYATVDKRDLDGKPLTIVGTSQRIDKQKEFEQALIEARNHAEESDRLKSAFLANISHEIRTPLNAIVGFSEVLPMTQSDEEREQLLGLIRDNNAQLLRLFDDMIHMSKLEAGGGTIRKSQFELRHLLEEIVQQYAGKVDESRVTMQVEQTDANLQVYTDRDRLGEIINQYVNNAVKFTSEGSITLGFEQREKVLRIWVKDTGKGIPEDRCDDHLFERFVKIDEFVPGTGLGLSICRSMALSLGGKVGVQSALGKGATFWVEIPLG
jgi:signal transduction histidine kinase